MTINIGSANWLPILGGLLAGIPGIVLGSGLVLSPRWTQILSIVGGVGVLLIGLAAKASTTHSTQAQVVKATQDAVPKP
jgi:hypothetical protein